MRQLYFIIWLSALLYKNTYLYILCCFIRHINLMSNTHRWAIKENSDIIFRLICYNVQVNEKIIRKKNVLNFICNYRLRCGYEQQVGGATTIRQWRIQGVGPSAPGNATQRIIFHCSVFMRKSLIHQAVFPQTWEIYSLVQWHKISIFQPISAISDDWKRNFIKIYIIKDTLSAIAWIFVSLLDVNPSQWYIEIPM